jgi:hypothetical protein
MHNGDTKDKMKNDNSKQFKKQALSQSDVVLPRTLGRIDI